MDNDKKINSEDILNAIDLNKIICADKKKRGRPKKNQQYINTSISKIKIHEPFNEEEEIILHLPISNTDIESYKNKNKIDIEPKTDKIQSENYDCNSESDSNEEEIKKEIDENIDINQKQYGLIIKKLKEENEKLKKYLMDITPMYFTEVKLYPIDLKIFDKQHNLIIPKKTNINCWWCTYDFDCLPTFIPDKYHDKQFYVFGCFCSFNCAGAYNLNLNDNKVWDRYSLLKQMYYMININNITSINDIEINISGPKELLEKYGGPMKIDEYRINSKILGREYHKLIPPFLPINISFEETTNSKTTHKSVSINQIINGNVKENMLIKRNKPVANLAKEIDNFIE